jgi:hypothetical protein
MRTTERASGAQLFINALTCEDRYRNFGDDRQAWHDCFADLWAALKGGAKVRCESLGKSSVAFHSLYGGDCHELRPTKIISSGESADSTLTYAIMCVDPGDEQGKPPYVMVCYSARRGDELDRIIL